MNKEDSREVLLTIRGEADESFGEDDSVTLETTGTFYREDDALCYSYEESEIYGMKGTTTIIKVKEDSVSIIRLGTVNSIMEFQIDQRNVMFYNTPYGELQIGIFTRSIDTEYNSENDLSYLKITYNLEIGNGVISENLIEVNVKY